MRRRDFLAAAAAATLLSRCRGATRRPSTGIVEAHRTAPESLDPTSAFSDIAHEFFGRVYSGFLRYDRDGRLVPDLAAVIEAAPESIRLVAREEAWWHDGKPVVAADIVETFRRYATDDYPFSSPFKAVRSVDVDRWPEVLLRLSHPSYALLHALSSRVLPAHVPDLDRNPVGCGFYAVAERLPETIVLAPHDRYHGTRATIARVECRTVPDPMTQYLQLLSGEADLAELSTDLHRAASADETFLKRIRVLSVPSKAVEFLFFNLRRIGDPALRRAIALTIDRADLCHHLYGGNARAVESPFLEEAWRDRDAPPAGCDPQRAASLLDAAGYARIEGRLVRDGRAVALTIISNADSTKRGLMAQTIAQWLTSRLGIDARVESLERGIFERRFFEGRYDAAIYGFSFSPDPDDLGNLYLSASEFNVSAYKSRDVDELFLRGRDLPEGEEKRLIYVDIQRLLARDLPSVPLLSYNIPMGVSRRIDFTPPSIIGDTYRFTREQNLWRLVERRD